MLRDSHRATENNAGSGCCARASDQLRQSPSRPRS